LAKRFLEKKNHEKLVHGKNLTTKIFPTKWYHIRKLWGNAHENREYHVMHGKNLTPKIFPTNGYHIQKLWGNDP